jgi:hypothetical protein
MSHTQESILHHNFIQQIPKSISSKVISIPDPQKDGKYQGNSKFQCKQSSGGQLNGGNKSDIVTDNDKSHSQWHAKA